MVKAVQVGKNQVVGGAMVEILATLQCCRSKQESEAVTALVPAGSPGKTLHQAACPMCGTEYVFGVAITTREQSIAKSQSKDASFEKVASEFLEEIGVDTEDYEPSELEVAMCVGCSGPIPFPVHPSKANAGEVREARYLCRGCKEFVCDGCIKYVQRVSGYHPSDWHWLPEGKRGKVVDTAANKHEKEDEGGFDLDDDLEGA